jgi:choline-glycine betaine transporter
MVLRRRNVLALFVVEIALFVLAGVTSKTSKHPGTVSNVFWGVFLVGVVVLVLLAVATLVQSRRSRAS